MKLTIAVILFASVLAGCSESQPPTAGDDAAQDAAMAAQRVFDMPYLMRELDNGLRVIVVKTDYPDIVTLQIPVQTGSRNEVEAGKSGFAHFFEHMMFRGTEKYPSDVYSDILKKAGAATNAYTTDDFTNYHITFTKPDLEKMIEVEADRFQNLSYSESDFRTEALAVKGEYLKNYSNPLVAAYEKSRSLAFDVHPYGHTTMGFIEDIEAMPDQIDYAEIFFDRWYRPENTAIVIVGDVDPEATFDLVSRYWGDWKRGTFTADIPAEPAPGGPVYEHIQWDGNTQPWLMIGFRSPAFVPGEKDLPAVRLLSSIYFSDSSALYQKLVLDEQLVDQLATNFPMSKDPNLNVIYARLTDERHAAAVEAAILATLTDARTRMIDARKVAETKSRLRYSFTSQLDNSGSIGAMLARFVQFDRTPETINELYQAYDQLTAADIRAFANRYFTDASRVTVSLSNSPAIEGIGRQQMLEELVASASALPAEPTPPASSAESSTVAEVIEARGERVPVAVVAKPLPSAPLIDVSILVHVGAGQDPAGKKGLAALTAAMLTDAGSATATIQEINDALYPLASSFSATVDKEMTRLSGQVHKDNLETWYRYVRSQLLNPGWREQDFTRLKTQQVSAIRTGLVGNNDEELAKEVLYSDIYGPEHPYGSLNLGNSSDIEALTLDDVKDFYARFYTINNLTVGLSGGYPDDFPSRLSADLQALPAGERVTTEVPVVVDTETNRATIVEKDTPAVAVSFGFPIDLKRGDPDWLALWLVRSYFGEHRSVNSHLFQRIREQRGMNYGDYAYIEYFPNGMFRSQPGTNLARQQQIFQVWIRPLRANNDAHFATRAAVFELDKLIDEGLSESDFEATRAFLTRFVSLITDGQSRQLGYALDSQYYEIDDFAEYVREGLAELTLADVNRVIRENLRTDDMHYVFVTNDAEDLKARLVGEQPSPLVYEAEKPAALLQEDGIIDSLALGFVERDIRVVPAENVFN